MSEVRLSRIIRELSVELEHSKNRIADLETRSTNLKSEKERAEQYVEEFRANYSLKDAEIERLKGELKEMEAIAKRNCTTADNLLEVSKMSHALLNVEGYREPPVGLVKKIKSILADISKEQARARKSESEKRAYMRIVKEKMTTYPMTTPNPKLFEEIMADYKAWQKEQKKKTP